MNNGSGLDKRGVIRSAGMVSAFVLLSRVFGFVRDMLMARAFGTSLGMSAFVTAFTIPNLFRGLFGEGALSSAFVPVFTETREKQPDRLWAFAARMQTALTLALFGLVALGMIAATAALVLLPMDMKTETVLRLLRIMLPYTLFICLAAFLSAMLNALHKFAFAALAPVVLNLVMIAALVGVCPFLDPGSDMRMTVVAWSVIVAGAIQWGMLLPPLLASGFRLRWAFDFSDPRIRRVGVLMGTTMIGMGLTQINVMVDRLLALFLSDGAASYLYYAERLIYLPLGMFGTALGTVLLPTFSRQAARGRLEQIRETLNHSTRLLMFVMFPAAVGLFALARPIVRVAYERGAFSPVSTDMTAFALQCYAPGLVVFSLLKVFIPVFYSTQDMKTPVRAGILCTCLNLLLKFVLIWPMSHGGIALATVLSSAVNVLLLAWLINDRMGSAGWLNMGGSAVRLFLASAIMAAAAWGVNETIPHLPWLGALPAFWVRLAALFGAMATALPVYLGATMLLRCPELRELLGAFRRRRAPRGAEAT